MCRVDRSYNPYDQTDPQVDSVIPIAGNFETNTGKGLEANYTRLRATDTQVQGLRVELKGGAYAKRKQMAVIDFECDRDRTGNEGFEALDQEALVERAVRKAEAKRTFKHWSGEAVDKEDDEDNGKSLKFVSYGPLDEKTDVLKLNWKTKYACRDAEEDDDRDDGRDKSGSHWGFFTWFILLFVHLFSTQSWQC